MFRRLIFAFGFCHMGWATGGAQLEREIILADHVGEGREDEEIRRWQRSVGVEAGTRDAYVRLGWAFVAKARQASDDGYYKLAEATMVAAEAMFGTSHEMRLLRGHALHMLHRFKDAEREARTLVDERGAPEDFGLLSDVLMEQGEIAEAVPALQRMVDLKPGPEAFSRIAHLRWLKGDDLGAEAAMREALRATPVMDRERRAWTMNRLSAFALHRGDADRARDFARAAHELMPEHAPSFFALGRAEVASGNAIAAVEWLRKAVKISALPEYQWWLADVLRAAGWTEEATETERELRQRGEVADPRTLALFLATRGAEVPIALRLARAELEQRADVFTHDALAWALRKSGDIEGAAEEMNAALAEGTSDARLFLHAGDIAWERGEREAAAVLFERARIGALTLTPSERLGLDAQRTRLVGPGATFGHPISRFSLSKIHIP